MPTRLERAEAALERERRKSDLKRLEKANDFLEAGFAMLKDRFHDKEFNDLAFDIREKIQESTARLHTVLIG